MIDKIIPLKIKRPSNFDLYQIFDCGQSFRILPDASAPNLFKGVAMGKVIKVSQDEHDLTFYGVTQEEYDTVWHSYFSIDTDYDALRNSIYLLRPDDSVLKEAMEYGKGIRLLRQEKWETLCSFIISQNNNIPRIRSLIEALSKELGDSIDFEESTYYSFPTPKVIREAGEAKLRELKTGFRAPYIIDAATKVDGGEIDLEFLDTLSTNELLNELMKIKGVGMKVASCVALFGYGRLDAFPIDVWVKRVFDHYYPSGFDFKSLGDKAGLVQQYLFYYERYKNIVL